MWQTIVSHSRNRQVKQTLLSCSGIVEDNISLIVEVEQSVLDARRHHDQNFPQSPILVIFSSFLSEWKRLLSAKWNFELPISASSDCQIPCPVHIITIPNLAAFSYKIPNADLQICQIPYQEGNNHIGLLSGRGLCVVLRPEYLNTAPCLPLYKRMSLYGLLLWDNVVKSNGKPTKI